MTRSVGIGIIGTGFARKVQIPAFLSCEGVSIVSVASANVENARATAAEAGAGHFTGDWRQVIAHPDTDLICISTPPRLHREISLAALKAGKHVLCEKPMAMSLAEAEEMSDAAESAGKLALIDHELRFQPGRLAALQMLREGAIGKVRHAKAVFHAPHRGDPNIPWNWWSDVSEGGGALGAIASHIIDSFHWLLGTEMAQLSCQLTTHIKERFDGTGALRAVTSDDQCNMLLKFADGGVADNATGLIAISMTDGPGYCNRIDLYGSKGALRIDARGELYISRQGQEDWSPVEVDLARSIAGVPDTGFARGFTAFAPELIAAVRSNSPAVPNAATFADGVAVQRVLDAARDSNSMGRRVAVR